ncbi:hypothetical protein RB201_01545 [Streptomyces sp. S1A(2023)]
MPHAALGLLFGVDRSTITRAIGEIRGLPAGRGCAVPDRTGPACGCGPWRMCSHTPRPKASSCGWTPPRSRSVGPRPAAADAVLLSRGSRSRTR